MCWRERGCGYQPGGVGAPGAGGCPKEPGCISEALNPWGKVKDSTGRLPSHRQVPGDSVCLIAVASGVPSERSGGPWVQLSTRKSSLVNALGRQSQFSGNLRQNLSPSRLQTQRLVPWGCCMAVQHPSCWHPLPGLGPASGAHKITRVGQPQLAATPCLVVTATGLWNPARRGMSSLSHGQGCSEPVSDPCFVCCRHPISSGHAGA